MLIVSFYFIIDNIFILTQSIQRDCRLPDEDIETQIGRIIGRVGPAMLLTSLSESIAFFLGALTPMPAVRLFSLYAGMSVLIDFLLQMTIFVSLITLDHRRTLDNRVDLFCCLQMSTDNDRSTNRRQHYRCVVSRQPETTMIEPSAIPLRTDIDVHESIETSNDGTLFHLFKNYYAPWIMNDYVRPVVIFVFVTWLAVSVAFIPYVKIGLEQNITMSKDSYMINYFASLKQYFAVGPPVYFIIKPGNVT
jgi:Niemann-Pick C1 protein